MKGHRNTNLIFKKLFSKITAMMFNQWNHFRMYRMFFSIKPFDKESIFLYQKICLILLKVSLKGFFESEKKGES